MKSWFLKREYAEKLIENEMGKVKFFKEGINKAEGVEAYYLLLRTTPNQKSRKIVQSKLLSDCNWTKNPESLSS